MKTFWVEWIITSSGLIEASGSGSYTILNNKITADDIQEIKILILTECNKTPNTSNFKYTTKNIIFTTFLEIGLEVR